MLLVFVVESLISVLFLLVFAIYIFFLRGVRLHHIITLLVGLFIVSVSQNAIWCNPHHQTITQEHRDFSKQINQSSASLSIFCSCSCSLKYQIGTQYKRQLREYKRFFNCNHRNGFALGSRFIFIMRDEWNQCKPEYNHF